MVFPSTSEKLARALAERDFSEPTAVQSAVLEAEAVGRDLLVSAQTGSGKTVAYGLAIASDLLDAEEMLPPAAAPLALVVAPTRELALQVQRELDWLYRYTDAKVIACVGGMDPRAERYRLSAGAHIVVGTPGRLRDHLERGALRIAELRAVVLDEADEMLDLGFREDLEFILDATPPERRSLLFSATLPKDIVGLARRYQNNALRVSVTSDRQAHADIDYRAVMVTPNGIEHATVNLLRHGDSPIALVFCNTRDSVRHMHAILVERGFAAVSLSGEMGQNERNRALQALRDGQARVCIATDVAARGIDLPNLGLVIHAELPNNGEVLQHRSGRTGRAGRKGVSVLVVPPGRRRRAEQLLNTIGVRAFWSAPPSADEIAALDRERLLQSPILDAEITDEDRSLAELLLASRTPEQIAAALARLYRAQLPAAEEISEDVAVSAPREQATPERKKKALLSQPGVWFRMAIGRDKNADPRWLLPLICRQGGITKQDIGAIRIFDRETKIEIDARIADQFLAAIRQDKKPEIRIEPMSEGAQDDAPPMRSDDNHSRATARDEHPPRHRERPSHDSALEHSAPRPRPRDDEGLRAQPRDAAPPRRPRARSDEAPRQDFHPLNAHTENAPPQTDERPARRPREERGAAPAREFRPGKPPYQAKARTGETRPSDTRKRDDERPARRPRDDSGAAPAREFRPGKPPYQAKARTGETRPSETRKRDDERPPRRPREETGAAPAREFRPGKSPLHPAKSRTEASRRRESDGDKPLHRGKAGAAPARTDRGPKSPHRGQGPASGKPWQTKTSGGKKRSPKA